jgi:hypothetical protein
MSADHWRRWLPLVLGLLVSLPALGVGLLHDDYLYRIAVVESVEGWNPVPFGLYDFTPRPESGAQWRELGYVPWWTGDDFYLRFFRPLSSLLLWADLRAFGEKLWIAHLHSIVWFVVLLAVVTSLHRRFTDTGTACQASIVYAVAVGHLSPAGWLSARHTLVAATFGLLALELHLRGREDRWRAGLFLAPVTVAFSMLGGELSLAALAMIFAYELFGQSVSLRRRLLSLLPYAALAGGYFFFYLAAGYGARGTGLYINPMTDPTRFLAAAAVRVPILLGELVAATPAVLATTQPAAQPAFAIWGALATALAVLMIVFLRRRLGANEQGALRWLVPGALVSLLPGAAGVLGGRALLPALVASSLLVALLMRRGAAAARRQDGTRVGRTVLWAAVVGLVFAHLVCAPAFRVGASFLWRGMSRETERIAAAAPDCGPHLVVLAAADPTVITYVPGAMVPTRRVERFRVLSAAPNDHRLENVTETGFDLVVVGERRPNFWERVHRDTPLQSGAVVSLGDLRVEIVEAVAHGPTRLRVDLRRPLDDPGLCLLVWRDGDLQLLEPPTPGAALDLPHQPGPMGI